MGHFAEKMRELDRVLALQQQEVVIREMRYKAEIEHRNDDVIKLFEIEHALRAQE